jgi:hypothetical protein
MALTFRAAKQSALSITEVDGNFTHFTGSHEVSGSVKMETLQLKNNMETPEVLEASIMVSASILYFASGSEWHAVNF